jgi:hypothetical protein
MSHLQQGLSPDLTEKGWQSLQLVRFAIGDFVQQLAPNQGNKPKQTQDNGRDTVPYGIGIQCSKFGIEGKQAALFANLGLELQLFGSDNVIR